MTLNSNATAEQKRFHQWCKDYGCMLTIIPNPDLHHIGGAKMKLKGCDKAGEWFLIPITSKWHNYYGEPNAIHANRKGFNKTWNTTEKQLWIELIVEYELEFGKKPMSESEYQIIVDRA